MKTSLLVAIASLACASAAAPTLLAVLKSSSPKPSVDAAVTPAGEVRVAQLVERESSAPGTAAVAKRETTSVEASDRLALNERDGKETLDAKDAKDAKGLPPEIAAGPESVLVGSLGFPPTFGTAFRTLPRSN